MVMLMFWHSYRLDLMASWMDESKFMSGSVYMAGDFLKQDHSEETMADLRALVAASNVSKGILCFLILLILLRSYPTKATCRSCCWRRGHWHRRLASTCRPHRQNFIACQSNDQEYSGLLASPTSSYARLKSSKLLSFY
jgi:hypothetical protein